METLTSILVFVFGLIAGVILDLLKDKITKSITKKIANRAKKRYRSSKIPNPPSNFPSFQIGNIRLPVASIIGSPLTPFLIDEVIVRYSPILRESKEDYPIQLKLAREFLIDQNKAAKGLNDDEINNVMVRLDNCVQGSEKEGDQRGGLTIDLSLTTYGNFFATNISLDYNVIPDSGFISQFFRNQSIREAYCNSSDYDLAKSYLANPPGVEVCLISRNLNQDPNCQLIIRKRSENVKLYKGYFQTSASGYMSVAHRDKNGVPNPFVTAIEETRQEVSDSLELLPSDYKLLGVALKWEELHPSFYGYIETGVSAAELVGDFSRDSYEGMLFSIPFDPENIVSHIYREQWTPVSALSVIATLIRFFSRKDVDEACRKIPSKSIDTYFDRS